MEDMNCVVAPTKISYHLVELKKNIKHRTELFAKVLTAKGWDVDVRGTDILVECDNTDYDEAGHFMDWFGRFIDKMTVV